jgi:hypothetical protein
MRRIAAAVLSLALIPGGSIGALAQNSGSTTPPGKKEAAAAMHQRHHEDAAGDRYTDALNILAASGYTGISNIAESGQNFTATANSPQNKPVSVTVDPASRTVTPNG